MKPATICPRLRLTALLLILLSDLPTAQADARPSKAMVTNAQEHYRRGTAYFNAKSYDQAIAEYEAAWQIVPLPGFLYNLGQAHRLKGDLREAADYYRRYLEADPKGEVSKEAKGYLLSLTHEIESQPKVDPPPPSPPISSPETPASASQPRLPPEVERPPAPVPPAEAKVDRLHSGWTKGKQRTFALVTGGIGVLAFVAGGIAGGIARSTWDDAKLLCDDRQVVCNEQGASLAHDAGRAADASTATFAVGGVLVAGAIALWCGGSCPTCTTGRNCLVSNDCLSGVCDNGKCVAWAPIGPYGARIDVLQVDPVTPSTVYAATAAGVFKTTNGAGSWMSVNTGLPLGAFALAIDPKTPAILYAAVGSVYKTMNAGTQWTAQGTGLPVAKIAALAIDPANTMTVYAGVGTDQGGVYKTTNGGGQWTAMSKGLQFAKVAALAVDPVNSLKVYAATDQGVFRTADGGMNWVSANSGLPQCIMNALALDPATPTTVYANGCSDGQVYKSVNGGMAWAPANNPFGFSLFPAALAIDPKAPSTVLARNGLGIYKSTDGGGTWKSANPPSLGNPISVADYGGPIALDPKTPSTAYAGTSSGVLKSVNGGTLWSIVNVGFPAVQVLSLAVDPANPMTIYAGGNAVFKATDGGSKWTFVLFYGPTQNSPIGALTLCPAAPMTVYAGTGLQVAKTSDGGANWTIFDTIPMNSPYVNALAVDPTTPSKVYAGITSEGIFRSVNGGASWTKWSNGNFTGFAVAVDPITPSNVYAGAGNGFFKSQNSGLTWSLVPNVGGVAAIAISPSSPMTVYAAGGMVLKSTNTGATWSVLNGSPQGMNTLVVDPQNPATVYGGGFLKGAYKTTDGGTNWKPINTGLTDLNVHALLIDPKVPTMIYAATEKGIYRSTTGGE